MIFRNIILKYVHNVITLQSRKSDQESAIFHLRSLLKFGIIQTHNPGLITNREDNIHVILINGLNKYKNHIYI